MSLKGNLVENDQGAAAPDAAEPEYNGSNRAVLSEAERQRLFEQQALVHMDLLYNTAVQMTHNVSDGEDLVQETFVRAYRFFDKFTPGTNCKAWLFRIMRNLFINSFRKRAREPQRVNFDDVEPILQARPPAEVAAMDLGNLDRVFEQLVEDDVKAALDQLPDEFRMVTVLSDIEGFTYREIAEIMQCPIGTVRSRLSRARRFLQKKLYGFARERGIVRSDDSASVVP
jgi:RNA polymerase sigma-70 factor (ECF subfamily)